MNQERQELLLDLLTKKVVYGLDEAEQRQLDEFDAKIVEAELRSMEIAAAAISVSGISAVEPLPKHLFSKIAADAKKFIKSAKPVAESPFPPETIRMGPAKDLLKGQPMTPWYSWRYCEGRVRSELGTTRS